MRRLSPATHQLRGTYRADRHSGSYRNLRKELALAAEYDWRPSRSDLAGLSPIARYFVFAARRKFSFNKPGGICVVASARAIDQLAELREAIRVEGERIAGSRGRPKTNPKVREHRLVERRLRQVLRRLDLLELADLSHAEMVQPEKSAWRAVSPNTSSSTLTSPPQSRNK